jgi:hypothetical protein
MAHTGPQRHKKKITRKQYLKIGDYLEYLLIDGRKIIMVVRCGM